MRIQLQWRHGHHWCAMRFCFLWGAWCIDHVTGLSRAHSSYRVSMCHSLSSHSLPMTRARPPRRQARKTTTAGYGKIARRRPCRPRCRWPRSRPRSSSSSSSSSNSNSTLALPAAAAAAPAGTSSSRRSSSTTRRSTMRRPWRRRDRARHDRAQRPRRVPCNVTTLPRPQTDTNTMTLFFFFLFTHCRLGTGWLEIPQDESIVYALVKCI